MPKMYLILQNAITGVIFKFCLHREKLPADSGCQALPTKKTSGSCPHVPEMYLILQNAIAGVVLNAAVRFQLRSCNAQANSDERSNIGMHTFMECAH